MSAAITSYRKLADAFDVTEGAVRKWVEHPGWKFGKGPWKESQIPEIAAWREENLKVDANADRKEALQKQIKDLSPIQLAKLNESRAKTKLLEHKFKKDSGRVHDVEECRTRRIRQIHALKAELLMLPKRVTKKMRASSSDAEAQAIMLHEIEAMLNKFAEQK